jgi:hypothetical protein
VHVYCWTTAQLNMGMHKISLPQQPHLLTVSGLPDTALKPVKDAFIDCHLHACCIVTDRQPLASTFHANFKVLHATNLSGLVVCAHRTKFPLMAGLMPDACQSNA